MDSPSLAALKPKLYPCQRQVVHEDLLISSSYHLCLIISFGCRFSSSVTSSIILAVPATTPAVGCPDGPERKVCVVINIDSAQ